MTAFPGRSIALYDITGDFEAEERLGETAVRFRDYEAAEPPLRRAVELAPRNAPARLELARVLALSGRHEEAADQCAVLESLSPDQEARQACRGIRTASP